jgi:ribulose-phosphate 3-epimerase
VTEGIVIAPSILAADLGHLAAVMAEIDPPAWHVDVMDGQFVPNITFGPPVVAAVRRATQAFVDVHLMVAAPERFIDAFADAGADGITIHAEATPHVHRALQRIHERRLRAGLAVNPFTPLAAIEAAIEALDLVLIMSVDPGFGGQRYLPGSEARLRAVRALIDAKRPGCRLQVDGGIDATTAPRAIAAGADVLVVGTAIFAAEGGAARGYETIAAASSSTRPI